jgi:hypothetical protein
MLNSARGYQDGENGQEAVDKDRIDDGTRTPCHPSKKKSTEDRGKCFQGGFAQVG